MLDLKLIKEQLPIAQKKLNAKEKGIDLKHIIELDDKLRAQKTTLEQLQAKRNTLSKQIGEMKKEGRNTDELLQVVNQIGIQIDALEKEIEPAKQKLQDILDKLPNIPDDLVPLKEDASFNECIKTYLKKPSFPFAVKNHIELGEKWGLFDFKRAAKISGSGFAVYTKKGALLEWALINFMFKIQLKHGFIPYMVPHLVKPEVLYAAGQLPKFNGQFFQIHDNDFELSLIPTAEVALCGLHIDEILEQKDLPLKYFAYTPCFRREAGAAGSHDRGLIRTHQFNKVEMFAFTTPNQSEIVFQQMLDCAEEILQSLNIHYRLMLLAAGDMSFAASKTVDIELWLPGQDRYYECSSVSNCSDFQARRAKIRFRDENQKIQLVHTLNGSGLATSRLMVALLENNQQEDGNVVLPKPLNEIFHGTNFTF